MRRFAPVRFAAAASLAISAALPAQSPRLQQATPPSTLPATQPTAPEQPQIPLTPSQRPPKRAQVTYSGGLLSVSADNASLNQILRQIADDTGMKITGSVRDDRVFGQYGPEDPAQILAELLDGTGSNMILSHPDGASSPELILTPRQGGPTPPNPNAAAFDDKPDQQEPAPDPQQQATPAEPVPPGNRTIVPITPASQTGAAPADGSQPDSPNGVKTPQQIYEQLQRLRQQQQQPTTPQ